MIKGEAQPFFCHITRRSQKARGHKIMDRSMLNDATSADDALTPGYMLNEISRAWNKFFLLLCLLRILFLKMLLRIMIRLHDGKLSSLPSVGRILDQPAFEEQSQCQVQNVGYDQGKFTQDANRLSFSEYSPPSCTLLLRACLSNRTPWVQAWYGEECRCHQRVSP